MKSGNSAHSSEQLWNSTASQQPAVPLLVSLSVPFSFTRACFPFSACVGVSTLFMCEEKKVREKNLERNLGVGVRVELAGGSKFGLLYFVRQMVDGNVHLVWL